jgi:hypothetical protein
MVRHESLSMDPGTARKGFMRRANSKQLGSIVSIFF